MTEGLKKRGAKPRADEQEPDRGIGCRASWQMTAKRISIKDTGCKSGGCASKVVELTSGDLSSVLDIGRRNE